jgi:hypothetical protein
MFSDVVGWKVLSYTMDTCFILDIFVNTRTAYVHEGRLVSEPRSVAKNYLCGPFFPVDRILNRSSNPRLADQPRICTHALAPHLSEQWWRACRSSRSSRLSA